MTCKNSQESLKKPPGSSYYAGVCFLTGPYDLAVDLVVFIVLSGNADDDLVSD